MQRSRMFDYNESSPLLGSDVEAMEPQGAAQVREAPHPPLPAATLPHVPAEDPQPLGPPVHTSRTSSLFKCIKQAVREITLEPMLFLKMMAEGNYGVVADTLEIDRVCRISLNYSAETCATSVQDNLTEVQVAVQREENLFNFNQGLMDSLIPLLVVMFAGSLSDLRGRKPPMLAVLLGFVAVGGVNLLVALNPTWPVQVLYVGTLIVDLTGSWVVFNMAVYSYVADISTPESRTRRLATLDAVWYLGGPLGRVLGGWLYRVSGFATVFALSMGLWFVCFLYTLLLVRESVDKTVARLEEKTQESRDARWGPLRHVVALCRTAFKTRPARGRRYLLWLVLLKLAVFLVQGHQMYLWSRRVLKWGAPEFSTWSSLDSVVHQAGMVAWVWVAARYFLHDSLVAVGGIVSIMLWSVVLACITEPGLWWLVTVASVVGMLEPAIEPALRTMLTTVVGDGEAGRVLALVGLLEAAWLSVDRSLYTFLYNAFVEVFPQINFVVQASLCPFLIVALLVLRAKLRGRSVATLTADLQRPSSLPQDAVYTLPRQGVTPERASSDSLQDSTHAHQQ